MQYEDKRHTDTEGRQPQDDRGRDWSATAAPRHVQDCRQTTGSWKRYDTILRHRQAPEHMALSITWFLTSSRQNREIISIVLSHPVCGPLLSSPNTPPTQASSFTYHSHRPDYETHEESCLPQTLSRARGPLPHIRWTLKDVCESKELRKALVRGKGVGVQLKFWWKFLWSNSSQPQSHGTGAEPPIIKYKHL